LNWEACNARQTAGVSTETSVVDPDQTCRLLARVLVQVAPGFLQSVGVTMNNIRNVTTPATAPAQAKRHTDANSKVSV